MPCQRKLSIILDPSGTQQMFYLQTYFKNQYSEVLDTISGKLSTRFDQSMLSHLMIVDNILLEGS